MKLAWLSKKRAKKTAQVALLLAGIAIFTFSLIGLYSIVKERYDIYIVVTGSMHPAIPRGSIVIVEKSTPYMLNNLKIGDMIAYQTMDTVFIHRLIDFQGNGALVLKGDAVPQSEIVTKDRVIGKVVFGVPGGGYVLTLLPLFIFAVVISLGARWG
ncbi:MAG: signal peptidase I [Aeropyrum sp.]|nr:signal peptidase I [Aeropyrum sp.]